MWLPRHLSPFLLAVVVVSPALASCDSAGGSPEGRTAPASSSTTTSRPDYSQVKLSVRVGGVTTTSRPTAPGSGVIQGRVLDDRGAAVPGAFVRAIYYRDPERPEVIEALSGPEGSYRFHRVYGGRWRLTTWREPGHARLKPADFFLASGERKKLNLRTKLIPAVAVTTATAPSPPLLDQRARLALRIIDQRVGGDGQVQRRPLVGVEASLSLPAGWSISAGMNPLVTDPAGEVRWDVTCEVEGKARASVAFGGIPYFFPVTCQVPEPVTTTTTTTTTPSAPSRR